MPTYIFSCSNKKHGKFEKYLSFAQFDELKDNTDCPKCGHVAKLTIPDEPPHSSVVQNNSFGKAAELNSKKLGKYGLEDKIAADQKKRKPLTKVKDKWFGTLGAEKTRKILGEKNPQQRKKAINDYILKGE